MSLLVSVLTPRWLVHVSDASPKGAPVPRTLVLRRPNARALVTLIGPNYLTGWLQETVGERAFADADQLAAALADRAGEGAPADAGDVSVLLTGWGLSSEGRDVSFRYLVTSFEDAEAEEEGARFTATGETMVPTPPRAGGRGTRPSKAYSVQVQTTSPLSDKARAAVDDLPRMVRRDASATEVAMAAAAIVAGESGGPVLLVHLVPEGEVEAAILDGEKVTPLGPDATIGCAALAPG